MARTGSGPRVSRTVVFIAAWAAHWQVLHQLHHHGRTAALERLAEDRWHQGTATGPDGRTWHIEQASGCVQHRVGFDGPFAEVRLTTIVDHIAERLTPADARQLEALVEQLHAAQRRIDDWRVIQRGYSMPWEMEARDAAHRASRALHALTRAVCQRELSEQLDLFATT